MGHITITGADEASVRATAQAVAHTLGAGPIR
jgi:hypothetical protein